MKGVFTTRTNPSYDDLPEVRYHFPKSYLNYVRRMVGDWIVYYEPRRSSADPSSRGGRLAYFATPRVTRIEQDPGRSGLYYAYVDEYIEFDNVVPFSFKGAYFESALRKDDGTTSKGAFGRAVRIISEEEYQVILDYGFALDLAAKDKEPARADDLLAAEDQQAFRRSVLTWQLARQSTFL